ncbi:MAG: hypothetical protein WBK64_01960, partial [Dethiobacteria bacterium]
MTKPTRELDHTLTRRRAIITVLDGAGVGALPDAAAYGDSGANTLLHVISAEGPLRLPNLQRLGLDEILSLSTDPSLFTSHPLLSEAGYYGRMASRAAGKDTT